jgi:hypothetical protein
MMLLWSFNLKLNFIKCVKNQVSLFFIFILRLIIFGNNYLQQIRSLNVLKTFKRLLLGLIDGGFMHFMMALRDDFESTRASLLHRQPLSILDATVSELTSEETRRSTMKMQSSDMVLATTSHGTSQSSIGHSSSQSTSKTGFCKWCKHNGHTINECLKFQHYKQKQASQQTVVVASSTPETPSQSTSLTTADVKDLIHQVLSQSSTALSVTLGKSQ